MIKRQKAEVHNPILTIVTRHMPRTRAKELIRLKTSLKSMKVSIQHLIVEDPNSGGLHRSAELIRETGDKVEGRYVWILDDDDICSDIKLASKIEALHDFEAPDIIVVKTKLRQQNPGGGPGSIFYLPYEETWKRKDMASFDIGNIACPGFIVTQALYKELIIEFGNTERLNCVDWPYLKAVRDAALSRNLQVHWLDTIAMEVVTKGGGQ